MPAAKPIRIMAWAWSHGFSLASIRNQVAGAVPPNAMSPYFGDHQRAAGFVRLLEQIEDHLDNLPYEEDYPVIPNPLPHRREAVTSGGAQDIFLDIDED